MTPEQNIPESESPFFEPPLPTWMQQVKALRIINEKADRANLTNYKMQLQNGHMTEDLYLELTDAIYVRRPLWDAE